MKVPTLLLVVVVFLGWLSFRHVEAGGTGWVSECAGPVAPELAVLAAAEATGGVLHGLTQEAPSSEVVARDTLGTMSVLGAWGSAFVASVRGVERPASAVRFESAAVSARQASLMACAPCPTVAVQPAGPVVVPAAAPAGYDAEQLANAAVIVQVGAAQGLGRRDQTIGVMTALGESGLRVLDRGDRVGPDSRGLFQQRDNGAWGSYEDRMDPTTSASSFFRVLAVVPGRDSMTPTEVAHRVQRNADPDHYTRFWAPAVQVVAAVGGGTAGAVLPPAGCTAGQGGTQQVGAVTPAGGRTTTDLVAFGQELRERGFRVGANAALGRPPRPGVHSPTSWHYREGGSGAIDVNSGVGGESDTEKRALSPVAQEAMGRGFGVQWLDGDNHDDHLHIDIGTTRDVGDMSRWLVPVTTEAG